MLGHNCWNTQPLQDGIRILGHLPTLAVQESEPEAFSDVDDIDEDFEPADYHGEFEEYEDPNEDNE